MGTILPITVAIIELHSAFLLRSCRPALCTSADVIVAPWLQACSGPIQTEQINVEGHALKRAVSTRTVRKSPDIAFRVSHSTSRFDLLSRMAIKLSQSSIPKIVISHGDHGLPCFRAIPDFSSLRLPLMENYYEVSLALVTHWPNLYSQSTHLPRGNYSAATSHRVEIMYVPCKAENGQTDRKAGGVEGRAPSHIFVYQRSCGVSTFHQTASQGFPPPFQGPPPLL